MLPTILWFICGFVVAVLTAVRVQLELIARGAATGWVAVVGGLLAGGLILALVLVVGLRLRSLRWTGIAFLVVPLTVLGLGYKGISTFPVQNFKSAEVRNEWDQLHPTLRLVLWLARAGDRDVVLTDIARTPEDYTLMGLEGRGQSPHFVQADGFAHAIDVRVSDAGALHNWARQGLFLLVGLDALRHKGTADHLHVSLPHVL